MYDSLSPILIALLIVFLVARLIQRVRARRAQQIMRRDYGADWGN